MGSFRVKFSLRAHRDIGSIVSYIAEDDPTAAARLGRELIAQGASLDLYHGLGTAVPERPGVQRIVHGVYLIIYTVNPTKKLVTIRRVWHGSRDLGKLRF